MAAAAILKIGLMAISRSLWHIFARNFIQGLKTIPQKPVCCQKFNSRKIQDGGGRHFENWFNGYISVARAYICTKFYTGTKNHTPQAIIFCTQNSIPKKSKMAAAAILKIGLMTISRSLWHIFAWNFTQRLKPILHKPFFCQNSIPAK